MIGAIHYPDYKPMRDAVERAYRQRADFIACGQPIPKWLEVQIEAIDLCSKDWERGMSLMIDGLQQEQETLRKAEIKWTTIISRTESLLTSYETRPNLEVLRTS